MISMSIRDEVRSLEEYRFRAQPEGIKLDQNEYPEDLPEAVRERALERIADADFHRYPEIHAQSLRAAIARFEGWSDDGVVVSAGSNVLIQAITIASAIGRRLVTVSPTFSVYAIQGRILAEDVTEVPLGPGFALPVGDLVDELNVGGGVLFLANPAAPTGNLHPDSDIHTVLDAADPQRWTVVLDEAYWQFSERHHLDLVRARPNVISLRTLSKAFGLGGVRLGYALTHPELAAQLQKVLLPFSVSAVQSAIGLAVLERPGFLEDRVTLIVRERERVSEALGSMPGVELFPSMTNFLLFRVEDAENVYRGLLDRGVIVRKQHGAPGLDGCLRVSIGLPADNDRFLAAARTLLTEEEVHV